MRSSIFQLLFIAIAVSLIGCNDKSKTVDRLVDKEHGDVLIEILDRALDGDEKAVLDLINPRIQKCRDGKVEGEKAFRVDQETVCLIGEVDRSALEQFNKISGAYSFVVVESFGGTGIDTLMIANHILNRANAVAIIPVSICYSACANWILFSGDYRIIRGDTVIGWHGGPSYFERPEDMSLPVYGLQMRTASQHFRYFRELMIDVDIVNQPASDAVIDKKYLEEHGVENTVWLSIPKLEDGEMVLESP